VFPGVAWYLLSASAVALAGVTQLGASSRPSPGRAAMGAGREDVMDKAGCIER
jgi:hypothetical protein